MSTKLNLLAVSKVCKGYISFANYEQVQLCAHFIFYPLQTSRITNHHHHIDLYNKLETRFQNNLFITSTRKT